MIAIIKNDQVVKPDTLMLANQNFVAIPITITFGSTLAASGGIVKAGTIFPANNATAMGVILHDIDISNGDGAGSLVLFGFINEKNIPVAPTNDARKALKGIWFLPLQANPVTTTSNK